VTINSIAHPKTCPDCHREEPTGIEHREYVEDGREAPSEIVDHYRCGACGTEWEATYQCYEISQPRRKAVTA